MIKPPKWSILDLIPMEQVAQVIIRIKRNIQINSNHVYNARIVLHLRIVYLHIRIVLRIQMLEQVHTDQQLWGSKSTDRVVIIIIIIINILIIIIIIIIIIITINLLCLCRSTKRRKTTQNDVCKTTQWITHLKVLIYTHCHGVKVGLLDVLIYSCDRHKQVYYYYNYLSRLACSHTKYKIIRTQST
jgi:hypothetical protein